MKRTFFKISVSFFTLLLCISLCACNSQKEQTDSESQKVDSTAVTESAQDSTVVKASAQESTDEILETVAPETEIVNNENWKQVYLNCLNENDDEYFEFALVYVNDDDVPELYKHGKQRPSSSELCWIYDDEVYSQSLFIDGFEYYEKGNLFLSTGVQAGVQGDYVYQINDSEATKLSQGTASRVIQGQERFTWNGEDVTEEEYEELRNAAFDSSEATTVNEYYTISDLLY